MIPLPSKHLQRPLNSYDLWKVIALAVMTVDHLGYYLYPDMLVLRAVGRAATPIFFFLLGYNQRYQFRSVLLLAASAVSIIEAAWLQTWFPLNILWSVLLGRLLLDWLARRPLPIAPWQMVLAVLIWLPPLWFVFDYGTLPLLFMLWGHAQRDTNPYARRWYAGAALVIYSVINATVFAFTPMDVGIAVAVMVAACFCLWKFQLTRVPDFLPQRLLLFFSHHALLYYVVHKTVLILLAVRWGAPL